MPDPFRSREDLSRKKKKRGGSLPSANAHTHTKKKSLVNTSDSLAVNWGGEKTSPSSLS